MLKNLLFLALVLLFTGCFETTTTTTYSSTSTSTAGADGTSVDGTSADGNSTSTSVDGTATVNDANITLNYTGFNFDFDCNGTPYDHLFAILNSANLRLINCKIDTIIWSGVSTKITIEHNSSVNIIKYDVSYGILEANQTHLDLVDENITKILLVYN